LKIDRPLVEYLAKLSRLDLTESEIADHERELDRILGLMESLVKVDVAEVPETAQVLDLRNVFRADVPAPSSERDTLLQNAPDSSGGYFSVPKVIG
jgi:aspartyl/glutamyl-tRNA(Asn/Gln) amidotransferase C subunit